MRKLTLLLFCIFTCLTSANAQITRVQARDAEWKNYVVPKTNFARQINPAKQFIFRVPADWKQEESQLIFNGPHSAKLTVTIEKVPDGYPLLDYFSAILQQVKDQPGVAEATVARKTHLQDLEAREIFLEAPDTEGEMLRSTTWITVSGPLAVSFNLKVPIAHAAEIEPFFKAVVQSVIFLSLDYASFELLRTTTIKTPAPGPIHEIESIVSSLNEVNADRQSAITRLTSLFSSHADVTVDLLLDRRPLVRAAAVEALARTNNNALIPILWELVDDNEPLIAEAAARAVATAPDLLPQVLKHSMAGFRTQTIARVWPFMAKDKRLALLQKIFGETAVAPSSPPPPRKAPPKPGVKVAVVDMVPVQPGKQPATPPSVVSAISIANDPNVQIGALTLLNSVTPEEFKLPLERVMAAKYDPLIAVALQVGNQRRESLSLDTVFKLIASPDKQVSKLAAQNLAFSATLADIPRIESLISKQTGDTKKDLLDELNSSVKKIRFKQELSTATTAIQRREIIRKAASDSPLANFAWSHDCESTIAGCASTAGQTLKSDFTVKPFAENLFPQKVKHFTAIPNPGQLVQKFHESLQSLQLDSPRAQSNFLLTIGLLRDGVARELSAPPDTASLIEYTGIDPSAPIALGVWTADGALDSTSSAERSAIVLRIKDRARFERAVERYQRTAGSFTYLTQGAAIATRFIAAWPAILPFAVQYATSEELSKPATPRTLQRYDFIGEKDWNGLRIKTIEHHWLDAEWQIYNSATHMAFIGDAVVLTPDLATLRELLSKVDNQTDRQHLAGNAQFRKSIESRGDVVYFSDLTAVMAEAGTTTKEAASKALERGAMNIAGSSWENMHHFDFEESEWAKPLGTFHPKELSAPRELLPASTIAYYLTSVDLAGLWSNQPKDLLMSSTIEAIANAWALDFKQEVLPELGPECGGVVFELGDFELNGGSLAGFCKLKSTKLADALKAGKLFRGVGPTADFAEVKVEGTAYFVGVRNGFLVVANNAKSLEAFDGKSNLASTRDYSRAVEKVPAGIVAFGGYNLEAAVAAARRKPLEGVQAEIANLLFSLASAFHSQNFYATATAGTVSGQSSVAMDREGRYRVADISYLPRGTNITFVTVEPAGLPITDQKRLSSLVLKVRAKSAGPIDNIKDDIKSPDQTVEQKAANELLLTVAARRGATDKRIELPVKDPELEQYLKSTPEFPADNKQVKDQAVQIAGNDRDAWSVARKLADWTHKNLEWKQVIRASADQTLATREADCSEFSQLFVTMARSLGLPARMVSGLAYSGKSFGGHAWVEVWAGKWIELDPTWGTDFVDATHIRNSSKSLVMSAALNLIELEVVEAKRSVTDFQKSPKALAEHLVKAIPTGDQSDVEAAIDLATLTDEFMGAGTWAKMTNVERDQMSSAYRRLMVEIQGYHFSSLYKMRLLYMNEKADEAEATCLLTPVDLMLKLRLVRRNGLWYLVEVVQTDTAYHLASETLRPTIATIEKTRAGQKAPPAGLTDFVRVLLLINNNSPKTISVVDNALKSKPDDKGLRLLKGLALTSDENTRADGLKLLRELGDQGFAPALYRLATELWTSEDENEMKEALAVYERYVALEPLDPRGFEGLATGYDHEKNLVKAEAAYRKVIELDPTDTDAYSGLVHFLAVNDRIDEAKKVLVAGEKYKNEEQDLFGWAVHVLWSDDEPKAAEKFALSEPLRLKTSYEANVALGRIYLNDGRYVDALRVAEIAAQLKKDWTEPHLLMAQIYRKQSRWGLAVKAAQRAIELDNEDSEGHYQLACALTRLRRIKEALAALSKAVELDEDQVEYMLEEPDLKALSSLPGFKKLIPQPAKQ